MVHTSDQRISLGRGWLTGLLGVILALGFISPGTAASSGQDIRMLWMENRIAEELVRLNLTSGQKEELKEALQELTANRAEIRSQVTGLLTARRDALLGSDQEKVKELDRQLRQLVADATRSSHKTLKSFVEGLTERQKEVLGRVLGIRLPQNVTQRSFVRPHQREDMRSHYRQNMRPQHREDRERRVVQREILFERQANRPLVQPFSLHGDRMGIVLRLLEQLD